MKSFDTVFEKTKTFYFTHSKFAIYFYLFLTWKCKKKLPNIESRVQNLMKKNDVQMNRKNLREDSFCNSILIKRKLKF